MEERRRKFTARLPIKSAIRPLIAAPIIAPIVRIEPKSEYCMYFKNIYMWDID